MTQQQVKHSQGMNIPSALSYFVLSFPFIRIQTFVQTQASFPGLTTEFIKKPANFYKGGNKKIIYFSRVFLLCKILW